MTDNQTEQTDKKVLKKGLQSSELWVVVGLGIYQQLKQQFGIDVGLTDSDLIEISGLVYVAGRGILKIVHAAGKVTKK